MCHKLNSVEYQLIGRIIVSLYLMKEEYIYTDQIKRQIVISLLITIHIIYIIIIHIIIYQFFITRWGSILFEHYISYNMYYNDLEISLSISLYIKQIHCVPFHLKTTATLKQTPTIVFLFSDLCSVLLLVPLLLTYIYVLLSICFRLSTLQAF